MTTTTAIRRLLLDDLEYRGSPEELTDDLPLIDRHVIDSLTIQTLMVRIESEFGVHVGDDDLVPENFSSIAAIARFVDGKRVTRR
jgi:acyl carrier protein